MGPKSPGETREHPKNASQPTPQSVLESSFLCRTRLVDELVRKLLNEIKTALF